MDTESLPLASITAAGDDDTVREVVCRHLEVTFRHALSGPAATKTEDYVVLITGAPHPFGNLAVVSSSGDLSSAKAVVEPLFAKGVPAAVVFAGGAVSEEVAEYLRDREFTHEESMPAMAADIDRVAETSLPDGFELARVGRGGAAEEEAWCRALAEGYEIPVGVARYFSPVTIGADTAPDAPIQFFAILEDGRPVCTSMLHLARGVAGIYCVATIGDRRGRGLGAHATAEPLRIVRELGYGVGVLQSSEAGHSVYRRLGFADFGSVPMFMRLPEAE